MKVFSSLFLSVLLFSGAVTAYEVKQNVPLHQAYPLTSPQPQLSLKQSSAIVAILSGKFVYGEKIARKLWCAGIIIFGIVLSVV